MVYQANVATPDFGASYDGRDDYRDGIFSSCVYMGNFRPGCESSNIENILRNRTKLLPILYLVEAVINRVYTLMQVSLYTRGRLYEGWIALSTG